MKYSKSNPPLYCPQNQSSWLKGARKNSTPVGILWHDTAAGNPKIGRYVQPDDAAEDREYWVKLLGKNKYGNDWNHVEHQAGLNCWIGKLDDGTITTVQAGPWATTPWGCGSGSKGSCNGYEKYSDGTTKYCGKHWVQFEICDDKYTDKEYFDACFEEACQLTAYICNEYNIDPKGTVKYNGVTVPTILCHADSYKLKLGGNHGDVYLWFNKFGKTMDDVRNRVAEILADEKKVEEKVMYYRVRKSWADSKSQVGAYKILENAINECNKAGYGYHVFDDSGKSVYSAAKVEETPELDTSYVNTSAIDPKAMWDYFKTTELNDYAIAGIMGNLFAESSLRPCNLQQTYEKSLGMTDAEYTAAVDSGVYTNFIKDSAGYGLAQWTFWSLKEQMYNYFKEKGKSISDGPTQMEFLVYQLKTSYKAVWQELLAAKSVREASDCMLLKFERPADQSEAVQVKRAGYGQAYYDKYHVEPPAVESPKDELPKAEESHSPEVIPETDITEAETKQVGNLLLNLLYNIIKIFKRIFNKN